MTNYAEEIADLVEPLAEKMSATATDQAVICFTGQVIQESEDDIGIKTGFIISGDSVAIQETLYASLAEAIEEGDLTFIRLLAEVVGDIVADYDLEDRLLDDQQETQVWH